MLVLLLVALWFKLKLQVTASRPRGHSRQVCAVVLKEGGNTEKSKGGDSEKMKGDCHVNGRALGR